MPMTFAHIWDSFQQLSSARQNNGFSNNPLSHQEIESFCWLTKTRFSIFELSIIRMLDSFSLTKIKPNLKDTE